MADRKREIYAQKIASDQGYSSYLYAYDSEIEKIIISFLEADSAPLENTTKVYQLAELVKKIHQGPALDNNPSIIAQTRTLFDNIKKYPQD